MTTSLALVTSLVALATLGTLRVAVSPGSAPVIPPTTSVGSSSSSPGPKRVRRRTVVALAAALLLALPLLASNLIDDRSDVDAAPTATAPYRVLTARDGALPGEMANVAAMVGATDAWTRGIDGSGVGVALIDSGVARTEGLDAPGAVIDGPDFTADAGTSAAHVDAAGHGTHLAGVIAGRPHRAEGAEGDFTGVAPGAHLINLKARAADGTTEVADVAEAVRWAIAHRVELNIRVLNLSFNTTNPSDDLAAALQDAWRAGITVVVSAGNDGTDATTLTAPADDPMLISVGATDHMGTVDTADDRLADFSSRGNAGAQPSLVAPGRSIVSRVAPGSEAEEQTEALVTDSLVKASGTSQSAAEVAGLVALLQQQRPGLTPDQVKALLLGSTSPVQGRPVGAGAGLVDVDRALRLPTPTFDGPAGGFGTPTAAPADTLIDPWSSNSWGSNSWGSNSWGSNSWGSNSWGSNSWGSNSWGSNSWGSNSWGSNSWGSNSWGSNSWGSNSWGSNSWGSNSWGSNSWGSNSWGSNSWGSNSWGSNSWGSNSWGSNSWGSNSWGSNSWGSNSWGSNSLGQQQLGQQLLGQQQLGQQLLGQQQLGQQLLGQQQLGLELLGQQQLGQQLLGQQQLGQQLLGQQQLGLELLGQQQLGLELLGQQQLGQQLLGLTPSR